MTKHATILWMDLEMTGLEPADDRIMEVGIIATNWDFTEIATYEATVRVDPELVEARMQIGKEFWDANPASRDSLVAQNLASGRESEVIEDEILAFIDTHFAPDTRILLGGNSIHQDRRFIVNEWKRLDSRLHYRMLDVSAWKVVFEGKYGKKFAKPNAHRALEDIRGSIVELQYYLGKIDNSKL